MKSLHGTIRLLPILVAVLCLSCQSVRVSKALLPISDASNLVACGDDKVLIIDPERSDDEHAEILWQWTQQDTEAQDMPDTLKRCFRSIDDCRTYEGNSLLLITSSSGGSMLIDIATKRTLWYALTPMAHAAALLPGGKIAVALSTHTQGNALHIYDRQRPMQPLCTDTLYSGHGVVWMPRQKRLYALGFQELREYRIEGLDSNSPTLRCERIFRLPAEGGHELSRVDDNRLFVSAHNYCFLFSLQTGEFLPCPHFNAMRDVKSATIENDFSRLVYTQATENWWTHTIEMFGPRKSIPLPDLRLYKVRTMSNRY